MLSLFENRLLVLSTACLPMSSNLLLMYDIHTGQRMKNIPLTEDMKEYGVLHAIESNRHSFFVSHQLSDHGPNTVSEIDSEGRVIRVFDNKEQLHCIYLALDSVGRLLVADWKNKSVVLLDERLKFITILLDKELLGNACPVRLNYNKNNNRLAVLLDNSHVKIFDCHMSPVNLTDRMSLWWLRHSRNSHSQLLKLKGILK
jgi:hypothetical protein